MLASVLLVVTKSGHPSYYNGSERKNQHHCTWPHRRGSNVESNRYEAVRSVSNSGQSDATSFFIGKVKKKEKKWRYVNKSDKYETSKSYKKKKDSAKQIMKIKKAYLINVWLRLMGERKKPGLITISFLT